MGIAATMDDLGRPAWIALMILGFIFWWPAGLALLFFMIWSRRMGCGGYGRGHWRRGRMNEMYDSAERWFRGHHREGRSGNRAFDEYRMETLRRLEEEQHEFMDFLRRLREAKDKAEFDQFLAERRHRPEGPAPEPAS